MTNTETPTSTDVPTTSTDIRAWLIERVSYYLERAPEQIDGTVSLSQYGLDSVYAFALCGDIEDTLGLPVDATLIWDVDTVDALTEHLTDLARVH
jgi:acyl carrier protein